MTDRRLNPHDNDEDEEFTGTIIIPEKKMETETEPSDSENKPPIAPMKYITREDREKELRDEYRKKLEEERLKNLTPGMNR